MTATASHSRLYAVGRLVLLVAAIALTVWGVSLVAFSNSMRDTRVGIPIAFWGVLAGYAAIRMGNARATVPAPSEEGPVAESELPASTELVRERDEAARREYEIRLELMLRRELEAGLREELAALRRDVAELRGDVLDAVDGRLRMERVEITRIIGSNLAALHDDGRISLNPAAADVTVPAAGPDVQPERPRNNEVGQDAPSWTTTTMSAGAGVAESAAPWARPSPGVRLPERSDTERERPAPFAPSGSGLGGATKWGGAVPVTDTAGTPEAGSVLPQAATDDVDVDPIAYAARSGLRFRARPAAPEAGTAIGSSAEESGAAPITVEPRPVTEPVDSRPDLAEPQLIRPRSEPLRPELPRPVVVEPVEPVQPVRSRSEPVEPEPVQPVRSRSEPVEPEPDQPVRSRSEPVEPEPGQPVQSQSKALETELVQPEPVEPEPVEPEPVEPETVEPETVEPETEVMEAESVEPVPDETRAPAGARADPITAYPENPPAARPAREDPFASLPRLSSFRLPDLPAGVSAAPVQVPTGLSEAEPAAAEPATARPGGYVGRRRHAADDTQTGEPASAGRHGAGPESGASPLPAPRTGPVPASRHRG